MSQDRKEIEDVAALARGRSGRKERPQVRVLCFRVREREIVRYSHKTQTSSHDAGPRVRMRLQQRFLVWNREKFEAVLRRVRIDGSWTCVSPNARIESNEETEKED